MMNSVRDDELTEYPETEYEDPAFNSTSNSVNNGNGLFSGKGAAKAQAMFLARRARAKQYTKIGYGANEDHPDLEHLDDSSSEESSSDEEVVPAHANIVQAYERIDRTRQERAQNRGPSQTFNLEGKEAEIFQKRQERMSKYVSDGQNKITEQLDLDDFQIKKVDEDKSEMPKFNIQLNHVQRNSENQNQQEEINPFQVNLKTTGRNLQEEPSQSVRAPEPISVRQTAPPVVTQNNQNGYANGHQSSPKMNGGENGVTQNGSRYGAGQLSNGHQDNILQDEDRPESVQSNDSMCSVTSTSSNYIAKPWNPSSFYSNSSNSFAFKRFSAPKGKITSISTTSKARQPTNPFLAMKARQGSLPNLDFNQVNSNASTPTPLTPVTPMSMPATPPTPSKPIGGPRAFSSVTPPGGKPKPQPPTQQQQQPPTRNSAPSAPNSWKPTGVAQPPAAPSPRNSAGRNENDLGYQPSSKNPHIIKAPKSNYQIPLPKEPKSSFKSVSAQPSIQTNSQTMNQAPIVTATPPATPLKSALKQSSPPMAPTQPQEEAQAAKPWAPKPVAAPQSKVQESDLTGSMSGQPQSNFMAPTKGSFTPMKWSPGGAGAQQPPSNQSASGFNETDSHQQVKQDFFQHQDNFDRQQQTFEQETQQQNHHQRNVSFTQLVVSPRTQRKPMPPTPAQKPEILVRTPDTKSIDISWDQGPGQAGRTSSNLSNGHMGSVESLDASEHIRVRQDSQSREPDVVIDVPKSPPVFADEHHQAAMSGYETVDQMSYNSNVTNSEIQAAQMNGDADDDTASVASFASTLENVDTQEMQAPSQVAPMAPPAPAAPPALGQQAQFNFQPNEKDETNAISATPTAMLFSAAFKNPPKLKHVPQPVVKNSMVNQETNQAAAAPAGPALTSWQPPQQSVQPPMKPVQPAAPKMNSVQAEKERIFQEQRRQEQEELDRQRQEEEQRRLEEQKQQAKFTQPSPQMGGATEQSLPPKRDSTKKVHFSETDLERRNLSAANYNKPATGFKPAAPTTQINLQDNAPMFQQAAAPMPTPKPSAPVTPVKPVGVSSVPRPKFRASATPVASSWNSESPRSSVSNLQDLDKSLNKKSEFNFKPSPVKKWSPTNPVEAKSIDISDLPPPGSMAPRNVSSAPISHPSAGPVPPVPVQSTPIAPPAVPARPPAPPMAPMAPVQQPVYTPPQPSHTGNSLVMDNLNQTYGANPVPIQNTLHQRRSSTGSQPPPPPPMKPKRPSGPGGWVPGMKPDVNQFTGAKKRGPLAPPKPPPKTAFSGMDLIQGPNAMFQKFNQASNPDAPLDQDRANLYLELLDDDMGPFSGETQSRPSSRGPVYRGNGFSLRDGYDSDSGIGYSRNRAPSPSPSMNGSESGGFVFDKNALKGRGAKMFERQKERMGKFTKDHKEEYKKYKGQQTRGAEGGHAQVSVLPAMDSVPSRPSLARKQPKNKEISDFNRITGNRRPLPPVGGRHSSVS